jgi:transposase
MVRTRGAPADPDQPGDREALGRSRGGYSTKLHLRVEGRGRPMVILATAGQRHEAPMLRKLMEQGAVKRPGPGRPRIGPDAVAGDKGYSYPSLRRYLRQRGIRAVIPSKSDQPRQRNVDKAAYRERNQVERTINRLKGFRRVATRYEKRDVNYLAMVTIAAIVLLWLE